MIKIDYGQLVKDMLGIAKDKLETNWNEAKPFAEKEFTAFAENIKLIASLKAEGKINEEQAKLYLDIQKSSMRIVLLTIEGLGLLAVESAINGSINAVKKTVNKAIGWDIL